MHKIIYTLLLTIFISTLYAKDLDKVSIQLSWKHQFQFAGYYMAKEKGFYEEKGLDVEIKEFQYGMNVSDEVINQKSTFGVGRPTLLIDRVNKKDVVLLAAILQSSPNILLATKDSNIKTIKDFKNKKLMVTGDAKNDATIMSMVFSSGLTIDDLIIQEHSFDIEDLISGKTDLMSSYISNEPYLLKNRGIESVIFDPKDYGFDFYNEILFTSEDEIFKNYKRVKKFTLATLRGWIYAFEHIDETIDLIIKQYNTQNKTYDALLNEAIFLQELAYRGTDRLGKIDNDKVNAMIDFYRLMGFITEQLSADEIVYNINDSKRYFSFEEKSYLKNRANINVCIDPNWMPFESFDRKGNHIGMTKDFFKLFKKHIGVDFNIIKTDTWSQSLEYAKLRKCDLLSLAMETKSRKEYMNFTTPYLSMPLVVATQSDVSFIDQIEDIYEQRVAIPKDYAFVEILKEKYPQIVLVEVENIQEGMKLLEQRKVYGYIGTIASVANSIQEDYMGILKISGKLPYNWELGVGVRSDDRILLSILDKAIHNISDIEKKEIFNKWTQLHINTKVDYSLVIKITIFFIILLIVVLYFYFSQKKLHKELSTAYDKLERLAITDKLTNLFNRHKTDEIILSEKERADRYGTPFGIILIDIDHFKSINDNFGHQVGDVVLKQFSSILKQHSRATDVVGRWGGEEFIILVPQTDKESILKFAKILKNEIEFHEFHHIGHLTSSIGASLYKDHEPIDNLIKRADDALYYVKNNGRNQIKFK